MLFVIDPRPYQATVDLAKAQIETQRAQLTLAQLDQDRTSKLERRDFAARATLDERNAQLAAAHASLAGTEAQLRRPSSISDGPRSPHRSPGKSPTTAWMSATWCRTRRS